MPKKTDEKRKEEPKKETPKKVEEPKKEIPPEEAPKPEKKEKAPKLEKKRKKDKRIHTLYKVEGDKVTRLLPVCERCGPGYFMADHGNRHTCGHCGFSKYKPAEK